jgi:hypothetical protein
MSSVDAVRFLKRLQRTGEIEDLRLGENEKRYLADG